MHVFNICMLKKRSNLEFFPYIIVMLKPLMPARTQAKCMSCTINSQLDLDSKPQMADSASQMLGLCKFIVACLSGC